MGAVRSGEIRALTGLRIVAAMWVVLFHFRPLLWEASPRLEADLGPLLDAGAAGVDLFFILSGFVLAWNYLQRMGPSFSAKATAHFLWLRLSRVWPVYLVTMHLAALWIITTLYIGDVPSPDADKLTALNYLKQFLMVQLWFEPFFDGTSWDGPAWSISAEWLAYLLFGGLVLVIFRIARASRARTLFLLAFCAALPPTLLLLASGVVYTPWSWLPRILAQFTAGALAAAAVRRLVIDGRGRRLAGYLSVVLGAAIVAILYHYAANPVAGIAGLRRPDLVQPVHDSRAGAHRLELGGGAVQPHDAEVGGQDGGGGIDPGGVDRRDGALPPRGGAGPAVDAFHGRR